MTSSPHADVRSYFDADLMLSIDLPVDWEVGTTDGFPLVVLAPEQHGFRANAGFSERRIEPPGKDGFLAAIEQLKAEQATDFAGYELVGERRSVQDGCPAYMLRCRWDLEEPPVRVAQVAALFAVSTGRLVEVHCTALAELEPQYVAGFRALLDSLRFIPTTN